MKITAVAALVVTSVFVAGSATLYATLPLPELELIERLNAVVQHRFQDLMPANFGMSRIAGPSSFGAHFYPKRTAPRDFQPEGRAEEEVIAALEERRTQVGFYLFGAAISDSPAADMNFRALKGPAVMTSGTLRPAWYPALALPVPNTAAANALPDWNAIYLLARKAMQSFQDGGNGFEAMSGSWTIAARPVIASQEKCVACHNNPAIRPSRATKLGGPIGGVLYAYRHDGR